VIEKCFDTEGGVRHGLYMNKAAPVPFPVVESGVIEVNTVVTET
jgi:hypothetical protein